MSGKCTSKHPLSHAGTGRPDRANRALEPAFVKPDERTKTDDLLFLRRLSKEIAFYDLTNTPQGNWLHFFEQDDFILLALIGARPLSYDRKTLGVLSDVIRIGTTPERASDAYKSLLELGFYLVHEVDGWYKKTVPDTPLRHFLDQAIKTIYSPLANRLIALYKGATIEPKLFDENSDSAKNRLSWQEFLQIRPSPVWFPDDADQTAESPWEEFLDSIAEDTESYGPNRTSPGTPLLSLIRNARSAVYAILNEWLNTIRYTQQELPAIIEKSIESHSKHEPHIGLILSFLDLLEHAREEMNSLTARHLDFYYKDVLGLRNKPAVPDRVHLIGEPAKHVDRVHIPKGTFLKAGKDDAGNELIYSTEEEGFINHAEITELRAIEITGEGLFAATAVRMADGLEEEYEDETEGWHPFRVQDKKLLTDQLWAEIGFAVSSGLLALSEGERTITLDIPGSGVPATDNDLKTAFRVYATGDEEWMELVVKHAEIATNKLTITVEAEPGIPPITAFDPEVHEGRYNAGIPVVKVLLNQAETPGVYHQIKNFQVNNITVTVDVKGAKNLIAETPAGKADTTRPFQPFGHAPVAGASFLVGSPEIFSKPLKSVTIHLGWQEHSKGNLSGYYNWNWTGSNPKNSDYNISVELLNKGIWDPAGGTDLFGGNLSDSKDVKIVEDSFSDFEPVQRVSFKRFSHDLKAGFVRMKISGLENLFGHKLYPKYLAEFIKDDSTDPDPELPVEPFTPEIASLSADYKAQVVIEPGKSASVYPVRFYHIHPFGIDDLSNSLTMPSGNKYLLPRYHQPGGVISQPFTGLLLAGISKFKAPGTLSFLVQVKDGTADPEIRAASIKWYYLSKTGWKELKKDQKLRDNTNHFQNHGLVTVDIPADAKTDNVIAGGEELMVWIKAATSGDINSIPKLLAFHSQAFTAVFTDRDNEPGHLSNALPAESISKLLEPDPGIKSISQPFASFGGRPSERSPRFYQRVSERLRHKDRGNSLWDYERIILEAFPDLFRVKCISHTAYAFEEEDGSILNAEFAPGYVSVLVVPDLRNRVHLNPLQPRVSLGRLEEIRHFLERRISPFAAEKLNVLNPHFETIRVELFAEFTPGTDELFNRKRLNEAIIRFLSPWAFGQADEFRFGTTIHKSVILNFVKHLPYVETVADFTMYHKTGSAPANEVSSAIASTARSILTSAVEHDVLEVSTC